MLNSQDKLSEICRILSRWVLHLEDLRARWRRPVRHQGWYT